MNRIQLLFFTALAIVSGSIFAQVKAPEANLSGIYAGKDGIFRWKNSGREAAFFGVNYTVPFAYGYRSHRRLGINPEEAITQDVYHLARLGVNAFRVHVWDTEISDSLGNLKNNEHLRLFDYLLSRLEDKGIYILITPIAFWGNGYPDKDEKTGSFSELYGKERALREESAFEAQERYLKQFFNHVNPYTGKRYSDDPWIIAAEINNEPHHSGSKARTTEYIDRMRMAIKSTGWSKPLFYNISESPAYADAVAASGVDGFSFQWYPTGLVAGHELKGNYLPNVDRYVTPFDTISSFRTKPRMVYEFDAADVMQPIMYPAMARSFRTARFQWATQFAYDPMATAYANTEYQTHYLNLAYTPAKAMSLLIAGEVFKTTPSGKSYGTYPEDSTFGAFKVSYRHQLSEMNTLLKFYYSNSTSDKPVNPKALEHVAGVGSSTVVSYSGSGAYFLDKVMDGVWRLEVMPDVVQLKDPFGSPSLEREVRRTVYKVHAFQIALPDLGASFTVRGVNQGNLFNGDATRGKVAVRPGTYILQRKGQRLWVPGAKERIGYIGINEFVAPKEKEEVNADEEKENNTMKESIAEPILYNPAKDQAISVVYPGGWGKNRYEYTGNATGATVLKLDHQKQDVEGFAAIDVYIKDRIKGLSKADTLLIKATSSRSNPLKVTFSDANGNAFSGELEMSATSDLLKIPLNKLRKDSLLLMPRPYPGFQPLYFLSGNEESPDWVNMEKLQLYYPVKGNSVFSVTVGAVSLKQSDH